ncbi:hypothetical protein Dimus_036085, partial [Dionaea muscipula]
SHFHNGTLVKTVWNQRVSPSRRGQQHLSRRCTRPIDVVVEILSNYWNLMPKVLVVEQEEVVADIIRAAMGIINTPSTNVICSVSPLIKPPSLELSQHLEHHDTNLTNRGHVLESVSLANAKHGSSITVRPPVHLLAGDSRLPNDDEVSAMTSANPVIGGARVFNPITSIDARRTSRPPTV